MNPFTVDELAQSARDRDPSWDGARARRVLASTLRLRERRLSRARLLRRGGIVAAAAMALVFVLLRGASSPAVARTSMDDPGELVAAHAVGDGGYVRD